MARIELDHVTKCYGDVVAVRDVTVAIEDNEFFCFFGPPSSGKTTLLRLILGLETPSAGEIRIDGKAVNHLAPAQRNLSMVFQNLALFPHMTARENLSFPLVERQVPAAKIASRLGGIVEKLHIAAILDKRPAHLSGGERQRVAIGRALMRDAAAYLMDDPISALDARLREETRVELKRLQREIGHTLIYVTHDQEEAMSVADRMAILERGAIRQIDTPQAIYDSPNCRYVAALIGAPSMNFIPGAIGEAGFRADESAWRQPVSSGIGASAERIEIGFRPEDATLHRNASGEGLTGAVVSVEPLGAFTVVVVACGPHTVKALLKGQPIFSIGESVMIAVPPERCAFFHRADGRWIDAATSAIETV
jgi:multiple sugar transport system ATP-binding protein